MDVRKRSYPSVPCSLSSPLATITETTVTFGSLGANPLQINFKDISLIRREQSRGILGKSLAVLDTIKIKSSLDDQEYVFTGFLSSKKTYQLMEAAWKAVLKVRLESAQSTMEVLDGMDQAPNVGETIGEEMLRRRPSLIEGVKESDFHSQFRIPKTEQLLADYNSCIYGRNYSELSGKLYVATHFLCFGSTPGDLLIILPFSQVHSLLHNKVTLKVVLNSYYTKDGKNKRRELIFGLKSSDLLPIIQKQWKETTRAITSYSQPASGYHSPKIPSSPAVPAALDSHSPSHGAVSLEEIDDRPASPLYNSTGLMNPTVVIPSPMAPQGLPVPLNPRPAHLPSFTTALNESLENLSRSQGSGSLYSSTSESPPISPRSSSPDPEIQSSSPKSTFRRLMKTPLGLSTEAIFGSLGATFSSGSFYGSFGGDVSPRNKDDLLGDFEETVSSNHSTAASTPLSDSYGTLPTITIITPQQPLQPSVQPLQTPLQPAQPIQPTQQAMSVTPPQNGARPEPTQYSWPISPPALRGTHAANASPTSENLISFDSEMEKHQRLIHSSSTSALIQFDGEDPPVTLSNGGSTLDLFGEMDLVVEPEPPLISESMTEDRENFTQNYLKTQETKVGQWEKYCNIYGRSPTMILTTQLNSLIKRGVPDSYRGEIWSFCSGASAKKLVNPNYYRRMLEKMATEVSPLKDEIERDLHRSCPEHEFFKTERGVSSLRNVLVAYAGRNPEIGYCQAMNIISSYLLIYMKEEDAFWVLSTVCEDLVVDVYHRSLVGTIVDEKVIDTLVGKFLPDLNAHLKKLGAPLGMVAQPWFLCLYIGYTPFQISLRILDWFFYRGNNSLFCIALAILKMKEEELLKEDDPGSILIKIKDKVPLDSEDELFEIAFEFWEVLSQEKIDDLRNLHRQEAIKNLEEATKTKALNELLEKTEFNGTEVEWLYNCFHEALALNIGNALTFTQFKPLYARCIPEWSTMANMVEQVFMAFDVGKKEKLDLTDFVFGLNKIRKGGVEHQFDFCFGLFSNNEPSVNKHQLYAIVSAFIRLHTKPQDELARHQMLTAFVDMVFEKLGTPDMLSRTEIIAEILDKPLLVDSFNIGEVPNQTNKDEVLPLP
eukprot:TRINITY_DN8163_c0_g1_i4.p1 TRINITY_DN8163_c0_g1~~TRINITY_DN8163_c0_g1_i4.p1  ORF type:complete len:1110 (-),score=273.11 TRINITY_DN8163_c0_g1_i4:85-3414(-)